MSDDTKPFSEIVRDYGQQQADHALHTADLWRSWAEQLDELIHDMPSFTRPWVHSEDGVPFQVEMGATNVVVPSAMRGRLHGVLANADAAAAALTRAAVIAENRSDELANAFAIDEAEGLVALVAPRDDECRCVVSCADDPPTMCSLSGEPHVHPDDGSDTFGRCPVHPDAPGDL
jgi:hypothetical protein